mmetsp:Transcript_39136/g.57515  ORF Transcript_39136/g.57515 Transcript_39136/m.57515 type:complete len:242 (-) Transcript_39136:454-1179(-)
MSHLRQSKDSLNKSQAGPKQISESGEAARLQTLQKPSNDQLSRTSSSASTASTASILRTPSRVPSISCTSSSASSSSKSSVVTFSWAASTAQWEGLPGQGPWVAPAPSKRWIADSKQPEGARRSRQANSKPRLQRADNHGQDKRTKHDRDMNKKEQHTAKFNAAISTDVGSNFVQNLEQLKAAIQRRYKHRRQNLDPYQAVRPPTRDSKERKTERRAFGLTKTEAKNAKARSSSGTRKIGP